VARSGPYGRTEKDNKEDSMRVCVAGASGAIRTGSVPGWIEKPRRLWDRRLDQFERPVDDLNGGPR
jgi:hypothetical protein